MRNRPRPHIDAYAPVHADALEQACIKHGGRMTAQRRVIARVLDSADDHPDVEEIHRRAKVIDPHISPATVYRTMRLFEDLKLVIRHKFDDGPSRYELALTLPHDHLIDVVSGRIIEFRDARIDALQVQIAHELGYDIVSYRLEIMVKPLPQTTSHSPERSYRRVKLPVLSGAKN